MALRRAAHSTSGLGLVAIAVVLVVWTKRHPWSWPLWLFGLWSLNHEARPEPPVDGRGSAALACSQVLHRPVALADVYLRSGGSYRVTYLHDPVPSLATVCVVEPGQAATSHRVPLNH